MQNGGLKEKIKQVPIVDVVAGYVHLTKNGKAHKGLCPFHEDKQPSLSVSAEKNVFYCFGCGAKGDAIKFVQLIEKVGFTEALKNLARKFKIDVPEDSFNGNGHNEEKRVIDRMRFEAVRHYASLLFSEEGREVLTYLKSRGFTEDTLKKYYVGYVPTKTTTEGFLYTKKYAQSEIVSSGLLAKEGDEYADRFHHRIVFPNIVHERVVHITGRALGKTQPKYLHLPGEIKYLYNEAALNSKDVVITEGIPDCLTLLQMGMPAVAVYGAKTFKKEWVEKFKQYEKVVLLLDGDVAGSSATIQIAELLKEKARIALLPEFQGKDVNEYFVSGATNKDFENLIATAKTLMEYKISSVPADTEKAKLFEALKPILCDLAAMEDVEAQNVLLHILKPHFVFTHQETKLYQKQIKTLRKQVIREKQEAEKEKPKELTPLEKMTDEEKEEAMRLLRNPQLLDIFLHDLEHLGCVGEEENKLLVGLALTSRKLNDPISLIIKGESSAGKNYLIKSVVQLFPDEDVEERTRLTSHALFYKEKDALKHKALIVYERHGSEESDYSIRSLQSEKKLIMEVPVKDEKTGKIKSEKYEVNGPVCFIETTTRPHIHAENETRCFDVFVDESKEQTKKIFSVQDNRYLPHVEMSHEAQEGIARKHKNAQRMLKSIPVVIPYIKHIHFPVEPLRVRRDRGRFLSMIEASAFWHQEQRERKIIGGKEYIVANLEDYTLAYRLASKVLAQALKEVTPKAEKLVKECETLRMPFSRRDVEKKMGWNRKTVLKFCDEAINLGYFETVQGANGKSYKYKIVKRVLQVSCGLLAPEELQEMMRNNGAGELMEVKHG